MTICFLDTETLGLDPDAPIWEFAAIRRTPDGDEVEYHCFIDHYPLPWYESLPEQFQQDYTARYSPRTAITTFTAAQLIVEATNGAHIIGAVPSFDTVRLSKLLRQTGVLMYPGSDDPWHYHLVDVENMIVGYLAAQGEVVHPPWKSDELSNAVGVDPDKYARHTAMGDVQWVRDQYDAVMQQQPAELPS